MTVDTRPDAFAVARSVLDEAQWDLADTDVIDGTVVAEHTRFVPAVPPALRHHCPDGICAEIAAEAMSLQLLITWRSRQAWAHAKKAEIRRIKTARGKQVKALRKQLVGGSA